METIIIQKEKNQWLCIEAEWQNHFVPCEDFLGSSDYGQELLDHILRMKHGDVIFRTVRDWTEANDFKIITKSENVDDLFSELSGKITKFLVNPITAAERLFTMEKKAAKGGCIPIVD